MVDKQEIYKEIYFLRKEADYLRYKADEEGYPANFQWELGIEVFYALKEDALNFRNNYMNVAIPDPGEREELMGIPVFANYRDPYVIKLWKEVK